MSFETIRPDYDFIDALARESIRLSRERRPENEDLARLFERLQKQEGLAGKAQTDALTAARMGLPQSPNAVLKVRYWRTGRHFPVNREQCALLGTALAFTEEEKRWLMCVWFDHSDKVFEKGTEDPDYISRRKLFDTLKDEFLDKLSPEFLRKAGVEPSRRAGSLRHLYYLDSMEYVCPRQRIPESVYREGPAASLPYDPQFRREMMLLGEIPRTVMIRHLLVMGLPFLNRKLLSDRLVSLGYHPLDETHSGIRGTRTDFALIRLLQEYEQACAGREPQVCLAWIREAMRMLDAAWVRNGAEKMRFMYFKGQGYFEQNR